MPSTGTLLQALGPCRFGHCGLPEPSSGTRSTMVSSCCPPEVDESPFQHPQELPATLFMLCSDSAKGMASQLGVTFLPGDTCLLAGERVGWVHLGGGGRGRGCYGAQLTGRPKASTVPGARSTVVRVSEVLVRSFLEVATVSYTCLYLIHCRHLPIVLEPTAPGS